MKNEVKNYLDVVNGPRVYGSNNAAGYELPGAPKLTFSLSADYQDHFMGDWDWFARTDVTYRGGFFIDTHDIAKTAPATRMNLRAGLESGGIRVEGYVNNVFDNDEITEAGIAMDTISANAAQNAIRFIAPTKRQFGVKASYRF